MSINRPADRRRRPRPRRRAQADAADAALRGQRRTRSSKLRADLEDATDRVLRAQAELDNYRKRARRELEDERRYAALPLLRDLLPVLDNMQRAIEAAEKSPQASGLLDGIKLVAQSLLTVLAKHDCKKIEALGSAVRSGRSRGDLAAALGRASSQTPCARGPGRLCAARPRGASGAGDRLQSRA